jgi:hypothetical protein
MEFVPFSIFGYLYSVMTRPGRCVVANGSGRLPPVRLRL